jgi:Domain of unknown function (DUF4258)
MNKKYLPYLLLAAMMVALLLIRECNSRPASNNGKKEAAGRGFKRDIARLTYSKHARCRMGCRYIDESEVEEIMQKGNINYGKSDLNASRSPEYALEGTTHDNQRVRIVFAQAASRTNVVTVIDLDTEWKCQCE